MAKDKDDTIFKNPGSLTETIQYHLNEPEPERKKKLRKGIKIFGKEYLLKKLGGLRYVDSGSPTKKATINKDISNVKEMNVKREPGLAKKLGIRIPARYKKPKTAKTPKKPKSGKRGKKGGK